MVRSSANYQTGSASMATKRLMGHDGQIPETATTEMRQTKRDRKDYKNNR